MADVVTFLKQSEIIKYISNPSSLNFISDLMPKPGSLGLGGSHRKTFRRRADERSLSILPGLPMMNRRRGLLDHLLPMTGPEDSSKEKEVDSPLKKEMSDNQGEILTSTTAKHMVQHSIGPINGYLPIAVYLAYRFERHEDFEGLLVFYKSYYPTNPEVQMIEKSDLLDCTYYCLELISYCCKYTENDVFNLILLDYSTLEDMLTPEIFTIFSGNGRQDLMARYFRLLHSQLKNRGFKKSQTNKVYIASKSMGSIKTTLRMPLQSDRSDALANWSNKGAIINRDTAILMATNYFQCIQDDLTLLDLFGYFKIDSKGIVEVVLETRDETRIIKLSQQMPELSLALDPEQLVKLKMYKLLILTDKFSLINTFNIPIRKRWTVFSEICSIIEKGNDEVEELCNVITSVNETFWDLNKFTKFFQALRSLLRKKPTEDDPGWIVYIQNPLLFYITLLYFFYRMKKQLDFNNSEIIELQKDMLNFCISYIQDTNSETLKMNLFDKDSNGREFLYYAMYIEEMRLLENDKIEGLLYQMWDINRSSMHKIYDFMRLNNFSKRTTRFDHTIYLKKYGDDMIEDDDDFEMEFRYTSNSVFMRLLPELGWPLILAIFDFIFSNRIQDVRVQENFDTHIVSTIFKRYPSFLIILYFLRASHFLSIAIKSYAIGHLNGEGEVLLGIYKTFMWLYFIQHIIYQYIFYDFWVLNISQMLIVIMNVAYMLYSALSLQEIGVVIRIFVRMAIVVVIFGTISSFLIILVAYPIHVLFVPFSQPINGEVFHDLNLFDSLYQGVLTCFEFAFGAVVLVRPYLEQDLWTYLMTFIMIIYSFFGNILLANMLVAFLTSQFNGTSMRAKFLTMSMQFDMIKIYNVKDMDSLFSLPYFLSIPALPWLFFITSHSKKNLSRKKRANMFLRKVNHVVNIFIPTSIIMNVRLLLLIAYNYVFVLLQLLWKTCSKFKRSIDLLLWIVCGPFLLIKMWLQDNFTMMVLMLNFKLEGADLLNFDLELDARNNLVDIFKKMQKVIVDDMNIDEDYLLVSELLNSMGITHFGNLIGEKLILGKKKDRGAPQKTVAKALFQATYTSDNMTKLPDLVRASESNPFNSKYKQPENILAPVLAMKFSSIDPETDEVVINLNFMRYKLMHNLTVEKVHRLISFDKKALLKASLYMTSSADIDIDRQIIKVSKWMVKTHENIKAFHQFAKECRIKAMLPDKSDKLSGTSNESGDSHD